MKRLSIAMLVNLLQLSISAQDDQSFITIPCQAKREADVQYRKITWYKVEIGSNKLIGLVMKDLCTQKTVLYKFTNLSYEVENDYSLLLPEAGKSDCGHYRCTLWPPVGHYIQDGDYEYYPLGLGCSISYAQSLILPDLCYTSEVTNISIQCNTNATLPCTALSYSEQYASITWYKKLPDDEGIIRISIHQHTPQLYKNYVNRTDVVITAEGSLVLMNVNYSQAGQYKCYVAGKVGYKNHNSYVLLNITASVTETTPTLDVTTKILLYSTGRNLVSPVDVKPLSLLAGFFIISLSKILLSFACVGGMAKYKKHRRRKLWI